MVEESKVIVKEKTPEEKRPVKKFFKSFVDVKKWAAYDEVSSHVKTTFGLFCKLFHPEKKIVRRETYEESIARLGLTEEQLANRKKVFLYSAFTYFIFAIGVLVYLIYLLMHKRLFASFFSFILVTLFFLTAYREHFWYMQMQQKKLGCNFYDWVNFVLKRTK